MGACIQPWRGSHESAVQALLSAQFLGAPLVQLPPWQLSPVVQALPSSQWVPLCLGWYRQPSIASHESVVQGLLSSQERDDPPRHLPLRHESAGVQASPSSQEVPSVAATWLQPRSASQESSVHGLPSSHEPQVPAHVAFQSSLPCGSLVAPK